MDDRTKRLEELLSEAVTFASLNLIPDDQWTEEAERFLYNKDEIWELPELKAQDECRNCGHPKKDHTGKCISDSGKIEWCCTVCECGCNRYTPPIDPCTQPMSKDPS